ncbi:MAG: hypothetical protein ABI761_09165 [Saprospiraceae bacterium]
MKSIAAFLLFVLFLSCQKSSLSDPNSIEGDYVTSAFLDPSCTAVEPGKLPTLKVFRSGQQNYDMVITRYLPVKSTTEISGIKLIEEGGEDKLVYQNKSAGSWKKVEGFGDQKILTISIQSDPTQFTYFVGQKK